MASSPRYAFPNTTRIVRIIAVAFVMLGGTRVARSLDYPTTFTFVEAPDPLSGINPTYPLTTTPLPAIGASFFDPHFGTVLTRVTQTDGYNSRHEYSRFDPFNADQSMIILITTGGTWRVYRTQTMPYNTTGSLVRDIDLREPRWDPTSPTLLWALENFSIVTLDVESGVKTVVKDFTSDATMGAIIAASPSWRITTREEGESSLDKRYWAFALQADDRADFRNLYLFTWDRQQDQVPGVRQLTDLEGELVDYVGMSPLGNYVVIGADPNATATIAGLMMANRELTQVHRLGYAIGHSDVGLDQNGREVIVGQNAATDYIEMIPIDWTTSPVSTPEQGYAGTNIVPVVVLYYDNESSHGLKTGGVHISCNYRGYALISTHIVPGVAEQNWLDRTIVLAKLDHTPRVFYLAKVHSSCQEEPERAYWEETHGAITNDGRKVVWASNWNENVGQEQMFLMQLDMPPDWAPARSRATRWELYR